MINGVDYLTRRLIASESLGSMYMGGGGGVVLLWLLQHGPV